MQHYVYYQDGKEKCSCNKQFSHYEDGRIYNFQSPKSGPSIQNPMNHEVKLGVEPSPLHTDAQRYQEVAEQIKNCAAPNKTISRQGILETASSLTSGDRNKSYGEPIDNMDLFAHLIDTYLTGKREVDGSNFIDVDAVDASIIMALSKIARIAMNRGHVDNYVDGAAYMAIAGECDQILKERGGYGT